MEWTFFIIVCRLCAFVYLLSAWTVPSGSAGGLILLLFLSLVFIVVNVWLHFFPPFFFYMYSEILHGHSLSLNMTALPILFTVLVFPRCIWFKKKQEEKRKVCLYTFFLLKGNFVNIAIKWLKTWVCYTHANCCVQVMHYIRMHDAVTLIQTLGCNLRTRWSCQWTHGMVVNS